MEAFSPVWCYEPGLKVLRPAAGDRGHAGALLSRFVTGPGLMFWNRDKRPSRTGTIGPFSTSVLLHLYGLIGLHLSVMKRIGNEGETETYFLDLELLLGFPLIEDLRV